MTAPRQAAVSAPAAGYGWPLGGLARARLWLVALLVAACLASAMGAIAVSHLTRDQYAHLQRLERERDQLQTEWGRLLLEESTWSSPGRIERLAGERLAMRLPALETIEVIEP